MSFFLGFWVSKAFPFVLFLIQTSRDKAEKNVRDSCGGRKKCILLRIHFSVAYPFRSIELPNVGCGT